ncbi:MAG TPA: TolC family protein [Kofleriaceae bacterium]|jgi:cobalt-zinc-cadmium efflux system outer membrane protein|nr:TolC family protein [Kofleriaceae bacterium]
MTRSSLCSLPIVTVVVWLSRPALAQEPLKTVALDQAIQLALAHNTDSRSADEDVASADGALVQSRLFSNPSVFVSSLARGVSPLMGPVPTQYGASWTVPIGGKRAAGIDAAHALVVAARATRIAARRQVELSVEKAFVAVLLDQAQLEFARQDEKGIHDTLALNELRYKDGKISYGDVLKLRLQVRTVEDTVRQGELQLANDRLELARLVGAATLAPDYQVAGALAPPVLAAPLVPEELLARALKNRTDYQALRADEQNLEALASQARRQPIPDLGVLVDYDRAPGTPSQYDIILTVAVPILDRNQGNITQAEAAARKAKIATEALRLQIREDVLQAVNAWNTTHARLAAYDGDILSTAKESLDITSHAYEQGRGSLLDYLDAEASYRDVERSYRSVVTDAVNAAATLRFVTGEDLR